jgi:hypothetical protein
VDWEPPVWAVWVAHVAWVESYTSKRALAETLLSFCFSTLSSFVDSLLQGPQGPPGLPGPAGPVGAPVSKDMCL